MTDSEKNDVANGRGEFCDPKPLFQKLPAFRTGQGFEWDDSSCNDEFWRQKFARDQGRLTTKRKQEEQQDTGGSSVGDQLESPYLVMSLKTGNKDASYTCRRQPYSPVDRQVSVKDKFREFAGGSWENCTDLARNEEGNVAPNVAENDSSVIPGKDICKVRIKGTSGKPQIESYDDVEMAKANKKRGNLESAFAPSGGKEITPKPKADVPSGDNDALRDRNVGTKEQGKTRRVCLPPVPKNSNDEPAVGQTNVVEKNLATKTRENGQALPSLRFEGAQFVSNATKDPITRLREKEATSLSSNNVANQPKGSKIGSPANGQEPPKTANEPPKTPDEPPKTPNEPPKTPDGPSKKDKEPPKKVKEPPKKRVAAPVPSIKNPDLNVPTWLRNVLQDNFFCLSNYQGTFLCGLLYLLFAFLRCLLMRDLEEDAITQDELTVLFVWGFATWYEASTGLLLLWGNVQSSFEVILVGIAFELLFCVSVLSHVLAIISQHRLFATLSTIDISLWMVFQLFLVTGSLLITMANYYQLRYQLKGNQTKLTSKGPPIPNAI